MKETKLDPCNLRLLFVDRCAVSVLEHTGGGLGSCLTERSQNLVLCCMFLLKLS
jgi:hypothetical protein